MQWINHVNSLQISEEQKREGRQERDDFEMSLDFAHGANWELSPGDRQPHLLVTGSPMRQIYSCSTLLSCASPVPLFPALSVRAGKERLCVQPGVLS